MEKQNFLVTFRKLLRRILKFKNQIIQKFKKQIIQRMIDLVIFLRDKDRLAQVVHQVGQVTFVLVTEEFRYIRYKGRKVLGIILALFDSRTNLACKWSLIRSILTSPLVAFTIAFFLYQRFWEYLPNRRRLRALFYRIIERPIEMFFERAEMFFQSDLGQRFLFGAVLGIVAVLVTYPFAFLLKVPPALQYVALGFRILLFVFFVVDTMFFYHLW